MRDEKQIRDEKSAALNGRLLARHVVPSATPLKSGLHSLPIEDGREVLLYVPTGYEPETAAPLTLLLHSAGGDARHGIALLQHDADEFGIVLLAPKSLRATWDVIADEFGADVWFIDQAVKQVFAQYNIDSTHLAVGGFSDGASYALSLGITNGDFFSHVIAFSPGFMAPKTQRAAPRIYISHGTGDRVLPIERCSRRIVPQLQNAGYDLLYSEFEGAHTIPPEISREAVEWFTSGLG